MKGAVQEVVNGIESKSGQALMGFLKRFRAAGIAVILMLDAAPTVAQGLLPDPSRQGEYRETVTGILGSFPNPYGIPPQLRQPTAAERASILQLQVSEAAGSDQGLRSEDNWRTIVAIMKRTFGPSHPLTAQAILRLSGALSLQARNTEAIELYRQAAEILRRALGARHDMTFEAVDGLIEMLKINGQFSEAERYVRQQIATIDDGAQDEFKKTARWMQVQKLTELKELLGLGSQALEDMRKLEYQIATGTYNRPATASLLESFPGYTLLTDRDGVGRLYRNQSWSELITAVKNQLVSDPRDEISRLRLRDQLGLLIVSLRKANRLGEIQPYAEQLLKMGLTDDAHDLEPRINNGTPFIIAEIRESLGLSLAANGRLLEAISQLRDACAMLSRVVIGDESAMIAPQPDPRGAPSCRAELASALFLQARASGERSLMEEALLNVQPGLVSSATIALRKSMSRAAASALGQSDAVASLEEIERKNRELHGAMGREFDSSQRAIETRASAERRAVIDKQLSGNRQATAAIDQGLRAGAPQYETFLNPAPVPLAQIQGRNGESILRSGEALILWVAPQDGARGYAVAISKEDFEWASIPVDRPDLERRVRLLRRQLDPCSIEPTPTCSDEVGRAFDTSVAFGLYQALLGNEGIQRVIAKAHTLIVIPSGILSTLPPSVLVASPDAGKSDLRATDWLIRHKAIAVVPGVAELQALRSLQKLGAKYTNPLIAIGEPDFSGRGATPRAIDSSTGASIDRSGGVAIGVKGSIASRISKLPPLPGTASEIRQLQNHLHATADDVFLYDRATEAKLKEKSTDGDLTRTRVLAIASHGLLPGELGQAEPALVLTPPLKPNERYDGLLTASEISQMNLNVEWVILSACNTAAPKRGSEEGFSGLASAFFSAGARSLLVSHWRVQDSATSKLIGTLFTFLGNDLLISKAEALRRAELAFIDGTVIASESADPEIRDAIAAKQAHPSFWAPFSYIGAPD